jgi:hypothetical protein
MTEHAPVGTKVRLAHRLRHGRDASLPAWLRCTVATEPVTDDDAEAVELRISEGDHEGERVTLVHLDEYVLDVEPLTYSGDPEWPFRYGWQAHASAAHLDAAGHLARPEARPFRRDPDTGEIDEAWRVVVTMTVRLAEALAGPTGQLYRIPDAGCPTA